MTVSRIGREGCRTYVRMAVVVLVEQYDPGVLTEGRGGESLCSLFFSLFTIPSPYEPQSSVFPGQVTIGMVTVPLLYV